MSSQSELAALRIRILIRDLRMLLIRQIFIYKTTLCHL